MHTRNQYIVNRLYFNKNKQSTTLWDYPSIPWFSWKYLPTPWVSEIFEDCRLAVHTVKA